MGSGASGADETAHVEVNKMKVAASNYLRFDAIPRHLSAPEPLVKICIASVIMNRCGTNRPNTTPNTGAVHGGKSAGTASRAGTSYIAIMRSDTECVAHHAALSLCGEVRLPVGNLTPQLERDPAFFVTQSFVAAAFILKHVIAQQIEAG